MDYGPAFAGGLDCYSHPPDCAEQYKEIIGAGLISRSGFVAINDTNSTRVRLPLFPSFESPFRRSHLPFGRVTAGHIVSTHTH
jgi:hypothetical protein